jgi:hypothetical protein
MLLPQLFAFSWADCFTYSFPNRFDSSFYPFWTDCVVISQTVFLGLSSGRDGLGGAVAVVTPLSECRVTFVTFFSCRAIGEFLMLGAGGACYLLPAKTTISQVCARNCSTGGHGHFAVLCADRPDGVHSANMSTVCFGGLIVSPHLTDATFSLDGGAELGLSSVNFTDCLTTGEGASVACKPGDRPITFSQLTIVGSSGQSLIRVDGRTTKAHLSHSVIVNNTVQTAVLAGDRYGIEVEATIFSGNGDKICSLTNPSNVFAFSNCVFSGPFPPTVAHAPASNLVFTQTATWAIAGWSTAWCRATPIAYRTQTVTLTRTEVASNRPSCTGPFTQSAWPIIHSGGDDSQTGGAGGLYGAIGGGAAIAGIVAGAVVFLVLRRRSHPAGTSARPLTEEVPGAGSPYVESSWQREPVAVVPPDGNGAQSGARSVAGLREDIDELL